jgi:hypothetical protein
MAYKSMHQATTKRNAAGAPPNKKIGRLLHQKNDIDKQTK